METLKTVIEFVGSGTGGGGTGTGGATAAASATSSSATADPLFTVCAVLAALVAIGISLFLYARHNKTAAASAIATHTRPSVSSQAWHANSVARGTKILIATICIIVAATFFAIFGHNNAIAQENSSATNGIATITEKITANVDDAGAVTLGKGVITNNHDTLAIGVRQVKSETDVDLSDSTLQIMCDEQELFNKTIGETQLNGTYTIVPVKESAELTYTIAMPAEKAKTLVGTQPITLITYVDSVVTKSGTVQLADKSLVAEAKVTYSYTDPYDGSKIITGETVTDANGNYIISDVQKGSKVTIEGYKKIGDREYYGKADSVSFDDETAISSLVLKVVPIASDFDFTAPVPRVYDGKAKEATFAPSSTCPAGMGNISKKEYSSDGGKTWSDKAINAGTYQVRINVDEGTGTAEVKGLTSDDWTFTIEKATATLTLVPTAASYTVPTAKIFTYEYVGDGKITVSSSDESVATASVDTSKNTVTVTPKTAGTATITVNAAAGTNYNAISADHTATVSAGTITVTPNPATGLFYNKSSQNLGNITTVPDDCKKEYRLSESAEWSETEPTATNAGTYTVYYKASKTGYSDVEDSFSVTIAKATPTLTVVPATGTYTVESTGTFTYTYDGDGSVSATSSDTSVITIDSVSGNTVSVTAVAVGSATITVSATETDNYEAASATHTANVVSASTITVTPNPAPDLTYNKSSQKLGNITTDPSDCKKEYRLSESESWSETEPTATNAGTYTVYYKASKTGYSDVESSFSVTIAKATPTLTVVPATGTYTVESTGTFTYTYDGDGNVTVLSSDTSIATIAVSDTTVTVTAGKIGYATITVSATETDNYNAASAEHKAAVTSTDGWKPLFDNVAGVKVYYYPVLGGTKNLQPDAFAYSTDGTNFTEITKPEGGYTMSGDVVTYAKSGQLYYKGGSVLTVRSVNDISYDATWDTTGATIYPYHANTLKTGTGTISEKIDTSLETVEKLCDDGVTPTPSSSNNPPLIDGVYVSAKNPAWQPYVQSIWYIYNKDKGWTTINDFGSQNGHFWSCVAYDSSNTNAYNWKGHDTQWYFGNRTSADRMCVLVSRVFS